MYFIRCRLRSVFFAVLTAAAILANPAFASSGTATVGQSVTFSVTVNGTAPFTYQWAKNAVAIPGATSATHTIASVALADAGTYTVVVANSAGSTTSDNAVLSVNAGAVAPTITTQPASATVTAGNSVSFTVGANGTAPLTYQWRKNGSNITGANSATYLIGSAQSSDAATYSVVIANSAGNATSDGATLTVTSATVAPSITTQPASATVTAGNSVSFTVGANGTAPLTYQWRKDGSNITGANSATYSIGSAQSADAGTYSVVVANSAGNVTSGPATLTVLGAARPPPSSSTAKLVNLSSRTQIGTGANITISGFVIGGTQPKTLLIRGTGPALTDFGVGGVVATPTMTVFSGDTPVLSNTGWKTGDVAQLRSESVRLGAFALPEDGRDCAILAEFAPGPYTVHLSDKNGGTGVGLIEVYDASSEGASKLVNLSVRAFAGRDSGVLITGLVVTGTTPKTVLVRAVGPGLTAFGVGGVLAQPKMSLFAGSQAIATNTRWTTSADRDAIVSIGAQVGAFPLDPSSNDSAMLLTLAPGAYTIHVSGADGGTGVALVETYAVD